MKLRVGHISQLLPQKCCITSHVKMSMIQTFIYLFKNTYFSHSLIYGVGWDLADVNRDWRNLAPGCKSSSSLLHVSHSGVQAAEVLAMREE